MQIVIVIMCALISIHALLAESDDSGDRNLTSHCNFYPRSPCGERHKTKQTQNPPRRFLSTLSLRRATGQRIKFKYVSSDFYPRSPCGERPGESGQRRLTSNFYPRSPCGERHSCNANLGRHRDFYPRSPCGERPPIIFRHCTTYLFLSTLSLRRATAFPGFLVGCINNFYPRSPCGERPLSGSSRATVLVFLSTLSLRRATCALLYRSGSAGISIHALLAESDFTLCKGASYGKDFYPRSPCGERLCHWRRCESAYRISIHALLAESDGVQRAGRCNRNDFYPRSPCGERHKAGLVRTALGHFYPRSPCGERLMHALKLARPVLFLSTLSLRRATHNL